VGKPKAKDEAGRTPAQESHQTRGGGEKTGRSDRKIDGGSGVVSRVYFRGIDRVTPSTSVEDSVLAKNSLRTTKSRWDGQLKVQWHLRGNQQQRLSKEGCTILMCLFK